MIENLGPPDWAGPDFLLPPASAQRDASMARRRPAMPDLKKCPLFAEYVICRAGLNPSGFDKIGKSFQNCRTKMCDFYTEFASFDLCFLSVYGNL